MLKQKALCKLQLEAQRMKTNPYLFWSKAIIFGVTFVLVNAATKYWWSDTIETNELIEIGLIGVFVGLVLQLVEYFSLKYKLKKHRAELYVFEKQQAEVDKLF